MHKRSICKCFSHVLKHKQERYESAARNVNWILNTYFIRAFSSNSERNKGLLIKSIFSLHRSLIMHKMPAHEYSSKPLQNKRNINWITNSLLFFGYYVQVSHTINNLFNVFITSGNFIGHETRHSGACENTVVELGFDNFLSARH